jgi:hypothetical protein
MHFLVFLIAVLPSLAIADCSSWGCTSTLNILYTKATGAIFVSTDDDEAEANCNAVSGQYFTVSPTAENKEQIYLSLLTAFNTGREIKIRIKEKSKNCEIAYVVLFNE